MHTLIMCSSNIILSSTNNTRPHLVQVENDWGAYDLRFRVQNEPQLHLQDNIEPPHYQRAHPRGRPQNLQRQNAQNNNQNIEIQIEDLANMVNNLATAFAQYVTNANPVVLPRIPVLTQGAV